MDDPEFAATDEEVILSTDDEGEPVAVVMGPEGPRITRHLHEPEAKPEEPKSDGDGDEPMPPPYESLRV